MICGAMDIANLQKGRGGKHESFRMRSALGRGEPARRGKREEIRKRSSEGRQGRKRGTGLRKYQTTM